MDQPTLSSFASPDRHVAISDIIRRTSTNPLDVRDVVLEGLDLSFATTVLDVGCGFGFMIEAVGKRVAPGALIEGVDTCAANSKAYLDRVDATGRAGGFHCRHIDTRLDWPDDSFDLVVASYSLYFFPRVLPEVARILRPGGMLLAVTHTQDSCRDLLRAVNVSESESQLLAVVSTFSAENGERLLAPWFGEVRRVDYHNSLAFEPRQRDDLFAYLRFKLPLLLSNANADGELPEPLVQAAGASLARQGGLSVDKSDAAFCCRNPRCP